MKKVFLLVDYQNDFVDGSLGFPDAAALDSKILNRIKEVEKLGYFIVLTKDVHYFDYLKTQEGRFLPIKHCIYNTKGADFYGSVGDYFWTNKPHKVLMKDNFGTFKLKDFLEELKDVDEVEIAGLITNICVLANAIIAKTTLPEATITINSELCATPNKETQEKTLEIMRLLQMKII